MKTTESILADVAGTAHMNDATLTFIREHRLDDVRKLAFMGDKFPSVDMPFALDQIQGWQTARHKLLSWAAVDSIIYPPHINMEQCSSEFTAAYKSKLSSTILGNNCQGKSLIDLTGGFGVDFSFMSRQFEHALYVERNTRLCEIAKHNFTMLGMENTEVINADSAEYIKVCPTVDMIYLDPARRDGNGIRVYNIADCQPNVVEMAPVLLQRAKTVMVKLSPMFDWHEAIRELPNVSQVHIISTNNECKELLVVMTSEGAQTKELYCINDDQRFICQIDGTTASAISPLGNLTADFAEKKNVLCVPNSSIMKAGCFNDVAAQFDLQSVGRNSHLFVSPKEVERFPGRQFLIMAVSSMNKRELRRNIAGITKANIAVRNFPMGVDALRKRLKLSDGGDVYIFATTAENGSHILIISKKVV